MAPRKTASKKAKSSKPAAKAEDVVIEGVAEEINPAEAGAVKTKTKKSPNQNKETADKKASSSGSNMVMVIALIALLLGATGATLGSLAYLNVMKKDDGPNLKETAEAVVDEKLSSTLPPIHADIETIKNSLDKRDAPDGSIQELRDKITVLETELEALKTSLNAQERVATGAQDHHHDDLVGLEKLNLELKNIRAEMAAIIAGLTPPAPHEVPTKSAVDDQFAQDEDRGWWGNLLNAFSISRVDETGKEAE